MKIDNLLDELNKIPASTVISEKIMAIRPQADASSQLVESELSGFSNEDEHFREFDQFREHNPA